MSTKTMAEVLVDHQRQNASSCLCGWAKLGHSHPEHQAEALSAAGFGLVADAGAKTLDDAMEKVRQELFDLSNDDGLTTQARAAYRDASRAIYTALTGKGGHAHD